MGEQRKKFNAVVIDDESKRNETYLKVLGNKYNVTIINDLSDFDRARIMQNDIMIIDVWFKKFTAFRIMEEYELTLPTVLVSGKWMEEGEPSEVILSVPKYKNIIKLISWNSFNKNDSNEQIGEEIFYQFCRYKNLLISGNKEKFSVLHLSDLQFGGKVAGGAFNDHFRIAQFLKEQEIEPEIIVITGDVADKGKKAEYMEAYEWLEELIKRIWGMKQDIEDVMKRIIIVPGNHDYDLSVSASDYYDFDFGAKEMGTFKKKANTYMNQKLGFNNYVRFMHKLSRNKGSFLYMDKAIHINETFRDWGIRFITLNSVYNINSDNCENNFGKFYCDLSPIESSALSSGINVNDESCNILIMHNPPENFRAGTENGEKSWARMQTIIQDNKIKLIMSGHTHDFRPAWRLRDAGGKYCNKAVCVSAPSARLNAASRTDDAARGFNIIDFYRVDGCIKKIIPRYFSMQKASITEIIDYSEEFIIE